MEDQEQSDNVSYYLVGQASMLAATAQAAKVSKLNRKLRLADEELDRVNRQFDETQGMQHYYIPEVICVLIL